MAVHCGVCASRISSAPENGGSFQTEDFGGWDERSRIEATCGTCAAQLAAAVAIEARRIREWNQKRVDELRERIRLERQRQEAYDKARREALAEVDRRFR